MNINILIANQMILAEKISGKESLLNPETGEIFLSTGEGLFPLLSENEFYPLTHFQQKNMLTATELLKSENNGILRENNGLSTVVLQKKEQKSNGQSTENQREIYGKITDNLRKLDSRLTEKRANEIIEKYNLQLFSQNFSGKIFDISEKIEKNSIAILFNTRKQSTIEKTRKDFRKAKELAAKAKDIELEQILKKLQARRAGQLKVQKMNDTIQKKEKKKKTKIIAFVSIIFFAAIFAIIRQIAIAYPAGKDKDKNIVVTEEIINNKIDEYEKINNTKVYSWRHKKIIKNLSGTELSPEELNDTLNYFITKAWKK